jgi:hypothetical protein
MFKLRSIVTALVLAAVLSPAAYAASSDKTFTVSNTGDGPLTITSAGISGNTAEYALLSGHNCTTVAAGSSCAMTVRFTPTGSGTRAAASLNFNSNGTNGGAHSIALSGAGGASCAAPKQVFLYTGADQYTSVPAGCSTATIKAWGAGGKATSSTNSRGGGGGFAQRTVGGLSAGSSLTVVIGQGALGISPTYGGGGAGADGSASSDTGGAGGGLSGVFSGAKSQATALAIAGGGGGAWKSNGGGAGGGLTGVAGTSGGGGGTQTAGGAGHTGGEAGSALKGGMADPGLMEDGGGGGGAGYWGGGGSTSFGGGGGGSGFAPGGTLTAGSGCSVANSGDSDYVTGIGNGGCSTSASGQNGRVVIIWQ